LIICVIFKPPRGRIGVMVIRPSLNIAILLPTCLLAGCGGNAPGHQPASGTSPSTTATTQAVAWSSVDLDVAEAVFRVQLPSDDSGTIDYYFLLLGGDDPPPEFLRRFASQKPRVFPASMAKESPNAGLTHEDLGGRGLILKVDKIKWLADGSANVVGGYYENGLSSLGNMYHVERQAGKWVVTKVTRLWIS
jgi:hypothetical protein